MEQLAEVRPAGIILREKDLNEDEYRELASYVMEQCRKRGTLCILHSFVQAAKELHAEALHLPLPVLRTLSQEEKSRFAILGASCHSPEEAAEAERLGCTYITAGHVFDTDCKKGLPGRGLAFLKQVCEKVSVPVYAIGGISPACMAEVRKAGASGVCVMSGAMECENVQEYFSAFEERKHEI